jgi:adenylate kinase family enzyme
MSRLRLVIASPGDVQEERDRAESAVAELNRNVAPERGLVVEVSRWEADAVPGLHRDGAQGLIDEALKIKDADCLVGVFWKRFGTPVPGAGSGTEHEILLAVEQWKKTGRPRVMLYFCQRPHTPQSTAEAAQWGKVLEFQERLGKEGLFQKFTSAEDFERLLRNQLTAWLKEFKPVFEPRDRSAYISRYVALIDASTSQIEILADKFHRSDMRPEAAEVNAALLRASRRGVKTRILHGAGFDRLAGALELVQASAATVRFDPEVPSSDINFTCFDRHDVMMGVKGSASQQTYKQTFAWAEIRSAQLAVTLARDFDRRWSAVRTRSLRSLMSEVLPGPIGEIGLDGVARQLGVPPSDLAGLMTTPSRVLFLVGRPGSGKTSVAVALKRSLTGARLPMAIAHLSDLEYVRRAFNESQSTRFQATDDGGWFITDPSLYDEAAKDLALRVKAAQTTNDLTLVEFARKSYADAIRIMADQGVSPDLIVYVDVPFTTACERNKARFAMGTGHYVSDKEMRETFKDDDIDAISQTNKVVRLTNASSSDLAEHAAVTLFNHLRDEPVTASVSSDRLKT